MLGAAAPAQARDALVTTFDGTRILTHFYPADNRGPGGRSPTVLVGPGYPNRGDTSPDADTSDNIGLATLRRNGYNVLTWDPRGIGGSSGTVMFDSPDFEARDVQALIDYVATLPEALLDGPNDPRVGMSGSSYGGGIQFQTASRDSRIEAIVPDVAWHSLDTSFFKENTVKTGWSALICGDPDADSLPGGLLGPAASILTRAASEMKSACLEGIGGVVSAGNRQWFADRGPRERVGSIRAAVLILHGTVDTLFPPAEAAANYDVLRRAGVPVKMMWYCGGHGMCSTSKGEPGHVQRAGLRWLDRYVKRDESVDTGPSFEWLADDGVWRSGPDYPLGDAGTIEAAGSSGRSMGISLLDSSQSGGPWNATPARNAVSIAFAAPPGASDIVGAPKLKLTYKGNSLTPNTHLYAQIVDARANRVLGAQVTPIPVTLDDRVRTVERELETIAVRAGSESAYRIQITPGTQVYTNSQRAIGGVILQRIEASLPLVDATRSGRPGAGRTPRRLVVKVSSRRVAGAARVTLSSRLRTRPCAGTVTFRVTVRGTTRSHNVRVPSSCTIRRTLRLRFRKGTSIRVRTRFNGNAELAPRTARSVTHRLR